MKRQGRCDRAPNMTQEEALTAVDPLQVYQTFIHSVICAYFCKRCEIRIEFFRLETPLSTLFARTRRTSGDIVSLEAQGRAPLSNISDLGILDALRIAGCDRCGPKQEDSSVGSSWFGTGLLIIFAKVKNGDRPRSFHQAGNEINWRLQWTGQTGL